MTAAEILAAAGAGLEELLDERLGQMLDERLKPFEEKLDQVLEAQLSGTVSLKDIAADIGKSYEWVRTTKWVQPNYGVPDIATETGRQKRWFRSTYINWRKYLQAHRNHWLGMTSHEQVRYMADLEQKLEVA